MQAVGYLMMFGAAVAAIVVIVVATAVIIVLWKLTRAGVRRWQGLRATGQPISPAQLLGVLLMALPGPLLALFVLTVAFWMGMIEFEYRQQTQDVEARLQQHRAELRRHMVGRYVFAATVRLRATRPRRAPALRRQHLFLPHQPRLRLHDRHCWYLAAERGPA